ncbi:MAG: hypothetical protein KDJ47_02695 [Hyphomicrobiaceae bacterium]|nr:hypothetical protein [Hyphomicrobiaceae bacterium]
MGFRVQQACAVALPRSGSIEDRVSDLDRETQCILKSFNTWAFKREQPTEPEMLAQVVATAVLHNLPVSFVLYWGKGPRARIARPDIACLDYLKAMGDRIAAVYEPGAQFHLCLTDTHARLNGHAEAVIDSYFGDISAAARVRNMAAVRLSLLVDRAGPGTSSDKPFPEEMLDSLVRCAARWYRGGDDPRQGALTYLGMNRVESQAVAAHYHESIFLTFNGSGYRNLFPESLPVFYMNSLRRGTAVKPWFMNEDCQPYVNAGAAGGSDL